MTLRWDVPQANLDAQFLADVTALLTAAPDAWVVTYGYRTYAEQNALYQAYLAGGPEAAPPNESAHQFGLAVDVAWVTPGGGLSWDYTQPAWAWLWAAVRASPSLHSGHDFPPVAPADDDHIEARRWAFATSAGQSMIATLKATGQWGQEVQPEAEA